MPNWVVSHYANEFAAVNSKCEAVLSGQAVNEGDRL